MRTRIIAILALLVTALGTHADDVVTVVTQNGQKSYDMDKLARIELGEDDLVRILTEPKNALVKQYQRMLGFDNAELEFEPAALHAIAKEAIDRNTGARGLRSICESVLQDTMYELPSDDTIQKVIVTPECVTEGGQPQVIRRGKRLAGGVA